MIGQKPRSLITLEKRGSTTKAATFFPSLTDFNFIVSETKRIFKDFSLRAGFSLPNPYSPSFARSSNSTFCETKMARRKFRSKPPELQARRRFGFFAQEHEHVCVSFLNQLQSSETEKQGLVQSQQNAGFQTRLEASLTSVVSTHGYP